VLDPPLPSSSTAQSQTTSSTLGSTQSSELVSFIRTFGKAFRDITVFQGGMATQLAEQFEQPIKNMTDYDYAELKHLKLELERSSLLYDQSVAKNLTSKTQLNEEKILSIQKELEDKKVILILTFSFFVGLFSLQTFELFIFYCSFFLTLLICYSSL
jgi:hypothetical protein